jgi:hypothetical protein
VLDDVLQRLLSDPVQRDLHVLGQPAVAGDDAHPHLGNGPGEAGQPVGQPEVLEHRRAQPGDRRVGLVQRQVGQLPGARELRCCGGAGWHRIGGRVEVIGEADQPLRDPVVDVAGQPVPFRFLGRDDLLGEPFRGLLLSRQPPVQPGLVHRPGDERPDRSEQPDVPVGEVAPLPGVHVQHADEAGRLALHGHRHHRRVVLPAQLGEVPVARVGLLARGEHRGLVMAGHPAAHPFAHREPDPAHLAVERRRRAGQRQRAATVVEHVDEAHVGAGRLDDEAGDAGGERTELRAGRDGLDDAGQQGVLPLRVGQAKPVPGPGAAHWNTPSRSAAATAAVLSLTPSLR